MSKVVPTQRLVDGLAGAWPERVESNITQAVDAIATFPHIGSSQVTSSISTACGDGIMKVAIRPFGLIYEHDKGDDAARLRGLISLRSVH